MKAAAWHVMSKDAQALNNLMFGEDENEGNKEWTCAKTKRMTRKKGRQNKRASEMLQVKCCFLTRLAGSSALLSAVIRSRNGKTCKGNLVQTH